MADLQGAQALLGKDQVQMKSLRKMVDHTKKYKKAVKVADGILRNNPNHGETLAYKALAVRHLSRKEESADLIKQALRATMMKAYKPWHISGTLHRLNGNYGAAVVAYKKALQLNDDELVLHDLANLQIQVRDLDGFYRTRGEILQKGMHMRRYYVAHAVAQYVRGNHADALETMDYLLSTAKIANKDFYERSELLMFKAQLLDESGQHEKALEFLTTFETVIVDKSGMNERKAAILLRLGRPDEARPVFESMLEGNPECYDYHRGLQACLLGILDISDMSGCELPVQNVTLTDEQHTSLSELYETMLARNPRPFAFRRIPLDFLEGDAFRAKADLFLRKGLRKGVPSLFSTLRPIYKVAFGRRPGKGYVARKTKVASSPEAKAAARARVEILGELVQGYLKELEANGALPSVAADDATPEDGKEAPTTLLWSLYFMAQHLDMSGKLDEKKKFTDLFRTNDEALKIIEQAIEHTPTLVDLYHVKGRILKHAGDLSNAADAVEAGRKLDLADKWINSKAAKFLLRADRVEEGDKVVALFARHEGDSRSYLMDMQCMWYEIEAGSASLRSGDVAMALKYFRSVEKHFSDFEEDQFDFHSYCIRKTTMRPYVALLRYEDRIRSDPFFTRAAHGAVKSYLMLHDQKDKFAKETSGEKPDFSHLPKNERKKASAQWRKAQKRREEAEAAAAAAAKAAAEEKAREEALDDDDSKKPRGRLRNLPVDEDPNGTKALGELTADPLKHAHELLKKVVKNAPDSLQTHLDTFDVEVRRRKYVRVARALHECCRLCPEEGLEHPAVFPRLVPFLHFLQTGKITYAPWAGASTSLKDINTPVDVAVSCDAVVREVVEEVLADFGAKGSAADLAKAYFSKYAAQPVDLERAVAAAKAMLLVNPTDRSPLTQVAVVPPGASFEMVRDTRTFLVDFDAPADVIKSFDAATREAFPQGEPVKANEST